MCDPVLSRYFPCLKVERKIVDEGKRHTEMSNKAVLCSNKKMGNLEGTRTENELIILYHVHYDHGQSLKPESFGK